MSDRWPFYIGAHVLVGVGHLRGQMVPDETTKWLGGTVTRLRGFYEFPPELDIEVNTFRGPAYIVMGNAWVRDWIRRDVTELL